MNGIRLRNFKESDSGRLLALANNKNISQNLRDGFPHPYTLKDAASFIQKCLAQDPVTIFAIEYNGEYVGNIGLFIGIDIYRKSAEMGYFIGEPYWNKGIATMAVNLITEFGFTELGLVRIYAGVFEYNPASMHVLEKCGFRKEAIHEKAIFKKDQIWDEHLFAKINPKFSH